MSETRIPFGKYKGDFITDLPSSYLTWLLTKYEEQPGYLDPTLARAVAMEAFARLILPIVEVNLIDHVTPRETRSSSDPFGVFNKTSGPRVGTDEPKPTPPPSPRDIDHELAREVVDAGYRTVARRVHPDTGGDGAKFNALVRTVEALRRYLSTLR